MSHPTPARKGYSRVQIGLHWAALVLIVAQFVFADGIGAAWRAVQDGTEVPYGPLVGAHVVGGVLVLAFAVWRLALRRTRGVPPLPEGGNPVQDKVAHGLHHLLYVLMILLPLSGGMAWFGGIGPAAGVHELLKALLLVAVVLHIAASLYHQFVLKDNLLLRMKRAEE